MARSQGRLHKLVDSFQQRVPVLTQIHRHLKNQCLFRGHSLQDRRFVEQVIPPQHLPVILNFTTGQILQNPKRNYEGTR